MDKVPNQLRKRIAIIVAEKLNTYCSTNKARKHNLSSTYVPFYDRHVPYSRIVLLNGEHIGSGNAKSDGVGGHREGGRAEMYGLA